MPHADDVPENGAESLTGGQPRFDIPPTKVVRANADKDQECRLRMMSRRMRAWQSTGAWSSRSS